MGEIDLGLGPVGGETPGIGRGSVICLVGEWKTGKAALASSFLEAGLKAGEEVVCLNPFGNEPDPFTVLDGRWKGSLRECDRFYQVKGGVNRNTFEEVLGSLLSEMRFPARGVLFSWTDLHVGMRDLSEVNQMAGRAVSRVKDRGFTSLVSFDPISSFDLRVTRALADLLLFVKGEGRSGTLSVDGESIKYPFFVDSGKPVFREEDERLSDVFSSVARRRVLEYLVSIHPDAAFQTEISAALGMQDVTVCGAARGVEGRYSAGRALVHRGLAEIERKDGRVFYRATERGVDAFYRYGGDDAQ